MLVTPRDFVSSIRTCFAAVTGNPVGGICGCAVQASVAPVLV